MITDAQDKQGKVKPCPNGCGKDIYFESRFGPDGKIILKKDQSGTRWFMMEDLSKQQHNCPNNKFKNVAVEKTQDLIQKDLLQPRTMDVADFAEPALRARVKLECKFIRIIEEEVTDFLLEHGQEAVPAKIGMYVKLIKDCVEKQ